MNIAALSVPMMQSNTSSTIGVAVLSKNLDTMEQTGAGLVKMMEQSVQPNLGQNFDFGI